MGFGTNFFIVSILFQLNTIANEASCVRFLPLHSYTDSDRAPPPIPNAAYGTSKAAVHWLTKRINAEEEKLTAFILSPGYEIP